ncbi:hypothetical protein H2201_006153 [Coniosporium apollinis]|uniref:Uncharacterized protein n=2 Tax=Coniosporium TaxID=2810619 RepID=A0ABQ9NQY6_9PEZI|nr:hypothetical protein H2199_000272 [Cladosporium sp. JES 115]KAJ9662223.1 hypothetical protein H2201_006153 [Coniosporium apollinis]
MPSHLRLQSNFEPFSAETTRTYFPTASPQPPQKKQKMSLTQTYYIAASARSKLGKEASRPDHNLRLLVGHANLLDSLMLDLQEAEREQEAWFNETVKKASRATESEHIEWADTIVEESREEWDGESDTSDSDSDSDIDEGDFEMISSPRRIPSPRPTIIHDDEDMYEDEEYDEEHALTRVSSSAQPPELVHDEDSDDESPPTSPPQMTIEYTEKQRKAIVTTGFFDEKHAPLSASAQSAFDQEGFFIPERNAPLIAAA